MDHTVTEALTLEITSMNMQAMTVTTACMLSSFSTCSFLLFFHGNDSNGMSYLLLNMSFADTQLRMNNIISLGII